MKTILCYGDSLTWGFEPGTRTRYPRETRWPDVLAAALENRVRVVSDGLRGRTTAYDDHLADCDRNGARILPTALHTHAPIDLVILMLGSNDMKPHIAGTAAASLQGLRRLVSIVRHHDTGIEGVAAPDVLIVAPPPLCETGNTEYAAVLAGGIVQSQMLASFYADLADELDCGFFDAGSVASTSPIDGVHIDAEGTRAIGKALAPMAHVMLGL